MGTLNVVVATRFRAGRDLGEFLPTPLSAESVTTSGASAQATAAPTDPTACWVLTAAGTSIWVKFGTNPTAVAGGDWLIPTGETRVFAVTPGQKVAAIDAS